MSKESGPFNNSLAEHDNTFFFDTVVQIHTYSPEFNPLAPFQMAGTREGRGTGFFVTPNVVMTAAHVVSKTYADTGVKVAIPSVGSNKLLSARVITFIPEIDVALIVITAPDFVPRTKFFTFGNDKLLVPGTALIVVGFPLGANGLKVHNSTFNGLQDGVIQIDSSINPGNSGGPVLINNSVIGIVSSGFDPRAANSVAFAIPIGVFLSTMPLDPLKVTPQTRILELPSLGIMYHNGTHAVSALDCQEGVNVQWVSHHSALFNHVHPGDKLCAIIVSEYEKNQSMSTEYKIDNNGDVKVSWYNSKIPLSHAIALIRVNTPIQVRFWNAQTKQVQTITTTLTPVFSGAYRPIYYPFEPFEYDPFGGIVVAPLRSIHLMLFRHLYFKLSPDEKELDHLVITYIFPNSLMAQAGIVSGGELLTSVNGKRTTTLSEYREALIHPLNDTSPPYIQWITKDNEKIDLSVTALLDEEPTLRKEYNLPESQVYLNLKKQFSSRPSQPSTTQPSTTPQPSTPQPSTTQPSPPQPSTTPQPNNKSELE